MDCPASPSGRTIDDGIYSIRTALDTGKALDVWGHSMEDGGDIRTYAYGGGRNERFQVRYLDDGTYSITALESGLALTATGTSNGSNVVQSAYSGSPLQRWVILDAGNGFFTVAPSESDAFLNIAGTLRETARRCKSGGPRLRRRSRSTSLSR